MGRKAGTVNVADLQRKVDLEYCARELWLERGEELPTDQEVDALLGYFGPLSLPEIQIVCRYPTQYSVNKEVERACKKARRFLQHKHGRELDDHSIAFWTEKT